MQNKIVLTPEMPYIFCIKAVIGDRVVLKNCYICASHLYRMHLGKTLKCDLVFCTRFSLYLQLL